MMAINLKKKEYDRLYQINNCEKLKQYRIDNKDKKRDHDKIYRATYLGVKSSRINTWKQIGIVNDDFNTLYDTYIETKNCEECEVELIHGNRGSNKKVLDHCHETGKVRNILCHLCNVRRK
tara:strand:+ start:1104 stop:1466 length:363 start_codon:yes stop_codon:yes gene_type:complete